MEMIQNTVMKSYIFHKDVSGYLELNIINLITDRELEREVSEEIL